MSDIYEYTDDNQKFDENSLTVDFYFDSKVTKDEALEIIDKMVDKINVKNERLLVSHKPTIFVKSPYV